jgi:hypothetical protein
MKTFADLLPGPDEYQGEIATGPLTFEGIPVPCCCTTTSFS